MLAEKVRRATAIGAWTGAICGTLVGASIAFSGPLAVLLVNAFGIDPAALNVDLVLKTDTATGQQWTIAEQDPISFQWVGPVAMAVSITVGYLVSRLTWRPTERQAASSGSVHK